MRIRLPIRFRVVYLITLAAVLLVAGAIAYSNMLVRKLAHKEEQLVRFWAESYHYLLNSLADTTQEGISPENSFLVNRLIIQQGDPEKRLFSVPAIVTDSAGNILNDNLLLDSSLTDAERKAVLQEELEQMRNYAQEPIVIDIPGNRQYLWYRETDELRLLRYYPYITLGVLGIFSLLVLAYLWTVQRSQQNRLWAGLAKETAHQLGTPISGLIAWIEIIRMQEHSEAAFIARELDRDVQQLQVIAERFGKIGSEPDLKPLELGPVLHQSVAYIRTRLGRSGKVQFVFTDELPAGARVLLSPTLFVWVIENLLKNAIDAMADREGTITVHAFARGPWLMIDVEDQG
ncbi:MAG: HAMP domain-containing histidine kinase, partial [Bacteroidetes bacterium]|nr:HAMP domain-containing histidine kinase [Bacteroidota bacterium]